MSERQTRDLDALRHRISSMSRDHLERYALSAAQAVDEYRTALNECQSQKRDAETVRVYHFHMGIAYHRDPVPETVRVPVPGGYRETVPGTERRYFHAGTHTVVGAASAIDVFRNVYHEMCRDLNLSETERQTVTVLSWYLMRNEL